MLLWGHVKFQPSNFQKFSVDSKYYSIVRGIEGPSLYEYKMWLTEEQLLETALLLLSSRKNQGEMPWMWAISLALLILGLLPYC